MGLKTGRLETDPLFLALTRPAMIVGLTYSWFTLEALGGMLYFINVKDFGGLIIYIIIVHSIGAIICSKEPRFMELIIVWSITCTKCTNKRFHSNTQSYDLY